MSESDQNENANQDRKKRHEHVIDLLDTSVPKISQLNIFDDTQLFPCQIQTKIKKVGGPIRRKKIGKLFFF